MRLLGREVHSESKGRCHQRVTPYRDKGVRRLVTLMGDRFSAVIGAPRLTRTGCTGIAIVHGAEVGVHPGWTSSRPLRAASRQYRIYSDNAVVALGWRGGKSFDRRLEFDHRLGRVSPPLFLTVTRAGWSSTVFAHELPPRSAGFNAENRLYLFALTVPRRVEEARLASESTRAA